MSICVTFSRVCNEHVTKGTYLVCDTKKCPSISGKSPGNEQKCIRVKSNFVHFITDTKNTVYTKYYLAYTVTTKNDLFKTSPRS